MLIIHSIIILCLHVADEIWVEHRYPAEVESKSEPESRLYSEQFRSLLDNGALSDVTFLVDGESIAAHRAILSARSEYFHAMFRVGGMSESRSGSEASPIHIPSADRASFKRMLEFLYTNTVRDLPDCSAVETIALLSLATEYLMKVRQGLRMRHCCGSCLSDNFNLNEYMYCMCVYIHKNFNLTGFWRALCKSCCDCDIHRDHWAVHVVWRRDFYSQRGLWAIRERARTCPRTRRCLSAASGVLPGAGAHAVRHPATQTEQRQHIARR